MEYPSKAKNLLVEARGRGYVFSRSEAGKLVVKEPDGGTADDRFVERLREAKAGLLACLVGEEVTASVSGWRESPAGPIPEKWSDAFGDDAAYWRNRIEGTAVYGSIYASEPDASTPAPAAVSKPETAPARPPAARPARTKKAAAEPPPADDGDLWGLQ